MFGYDKCSVFCDVIMKRILAVIILLASLSNCGLLPDPDDLLTHSQRLTEKKSCRNCNLTKEDLSGANFFKAKLNRANLGNTTMPDGKADYRDC